MWKVGDKVEARIPNTNRVTECEILNISHEGNICEVMEIDTQDKWMTAISEISCIYYFVEYWGEDCTLVGAGLARCDACPNKPNLADYPEAELNELADW